MQPLGFPMPDVQVRPHDEPSTGADEAATERLCTVLDAAVGLRLHDHWRLGFRLRDHR